MERNEIEFEVRGNNCVDCEIVISGRDNTLGAALCGKFYAGLIEGKASLGLEEGMMIFAAENVSCKFPVDENREELIEKLLKYGRFRLEPIEDGFNSGFIISRDF